MEFTDTHVHFWDRYQPQLSYTWLEPHVIHPVAGDYEAIKAPQYLPEHFAAETRFTGLRKVVHVQAALGTADPVDETLWLEALSEAFATPMALVAYANLEDPALDRVLERQLASGRVCGIRDLRHDDYFQSEGWRTGYARLAQHDLVFCDDPDVEQMPDAAALAARHPQLSYCVDHAGFPQRRDAAYFDRWRDGMRALARVDNTLVKVSGLGMGDHRWTVDSLRPWVLACIELWGVHRVVFGSNWPCDRVYSSYVDVWDAYAQIIEDFTPAERHDLLIGNAERVFRLD